MVPEYRTCEHDLYFAQHRVLLMTWFLFQVVTQRPVTWCDDPDMAVSYIGNYNWSHVNATVSVKIEGTDGVFVALRYLLGEFLAKYRVILKIRSYKMLVRPFGASSLLIA